MLVPVGDGARGPWTRLGGLAGVWTLDASLGHGLFIQSVWPQNVPSATLRSVSASWKLQTGEAQGT